MEGKFIIYQLLPRVFGNTNEFCVPNSSIDINGCGKFNDINDTVIERIKSLGVTHIWYTGIIEHATCTDYSNYGIPSNNHSYVKGVAGSPYAIKDYYDVDPDLAVNPNNRLEEFEELIIRTHRKGVKVIIDLVPNHVAREYISDIMPDDDFSFTNENFYLLDGELKLPVENLDNYKENPCKATGNDCFSTSPGLNDWYDTVKLNYDNRGTWLKMLKIAQYWADKGIDGFRCDMAEMVPVEFWNWFISTLKKSCPSLVFIAEIYQRENYLKFIEYCGFDYLYDKTGLYDTLKEISLGKRPAHTITEVWQSNGKIQDKMLNFLENHDEVRIASSFFLNDAFKAIPSMAVSLLLNKSPFMIYAGQEFGEAGMDIEGYSGLDGKTTIFDYWSVNSIRKWLKTGESNGLYAFYQFLLNLAIKEDAFRIGEMYDVNYANLDSNYYNNNFNYSFIRYYNKTIYLVVTNFGEIDLDIKVNIPQHAFEYLNIVNKKISDGVNELSPKKPIDISIEKYSVKILRYIVSN